MIQINAIPAPAPKAIIEINGGKRKSRKWKKRKFDG